MCLAAQDLIVKKDGDEIKAKVLEIGINELKYKRTDNPTGPLYVINKTDVFMIKYKNGTKDYLNGKAPVNVAENVIAIKQINTGKNKISEPVICKRTIDDVYKTKKIYYYGMDFSHMKFVDPKHDHNGQEIVQVMDKWELLVHEHHNQKWFEKKLVVDTVVFLPQYGLSQSRKSNPSTIIGTESFVLNMDSVKNWIKQYDFKEKDGIGYLVFADCFYQPKKNTSLTFVFFDITTKQVLLCDKYDANEADGYGLPHYWSVSLLVTIDRFNGDKIRSVKKDLSKKIK